MTTLFDEMQTFSLLSNKPVIFNDTMCYWRGLLMHKQVAFNIATSIFAKLSVSRSCNEHLWELQYDMLEDIKRQYGWVPDFKIGKFQGADLFKYLHKKIYQIYEKDSEFCKDWRESPHTMFWFFFDPQ
jgi:hypothetical protein